LAAGVHPLPALQRRDCAAVGEAALGGRREIVRTVVGQRFKRALPAGTRHARVEGAAEGARGADVGVARVGTLPEEPVKMRGSVWQPMQRRCHG